jgi:hypothetical protein
MEAEGAGGTMHVAMAHVPVSEMVLVCFMCVMVLVCTCM